MFPHFTDEKTEAQKREMVFWGTELLVNRGDRICTRV